jgi:hypothetical protein
MYNTHSHNDAYFIDVIFLAKQERANLREN